MTTPLTLTTLSGQVYSVISGRLITLARGPWTADVELDASSIQQFGMPSGRCTLLFGNVPLSGTIDPTASGTFGPTAKARVVAGGNGWSTYPPASDYHADNGTLSTVVYQAVASAVGEVLIDLAPATLGVDVVVSNASPASQVFGDGSWFVDTTGTTYVGPRPSAVADPTLVIRDFDPIHQRVTFSCETLLLPNTTLVDSRFNGANLVTQNVEQLFDSNGSTGWAWANSTGASLIVDDLKAATLSWTRAAYLRAYRYRLVQYQGEGPGGGPSRMALQAVTPSAGVPNIVPIAPWSGVAGVVSTLGPSQEVLVTFEDANPTLPRVIGYSLLGLPLSTTMDAQTSLAIGPTCPAVSLGGGASALVPAPWATALASALATFASTASSASNVAQVAIAASALANALSHLPPDATTKVKAT